MAWKGSLLDERNDREYMRAAERRASRRDALRTLGGGALGLLAANKARSSNATALQATPEAQKSAGPPNIILILTDDMRADDLQYMPAVQSLLVAQGATFSTFACSSPGCGPARATILRGQYPHNHGVLRGSGDIGGADVFQKLGDEKSMIATWLHDAGYRTALIGKYINGYGATVAPTYIPPGWDEWDGATNEGYSRFEINENGKLVRYKSGKEEVHSTDVFAGLARDFIAETAPTGQPFFLHLTPRAPHGPAEPASRYLSAFPGLTLPRTDAYNEADVSDKPTWVQLLPSLTEAQMVELDAYFRARLQTLLAVDDMVSHLIDELRKANILDNTYIAFSSDNGYGLGEHRVVQDKGSPYEEAILVPLVVRGPGIPANSTIEALASQVDLAPTFAAWADVVPPDFVDGRSLASLLRGEPTPPDWRQFLLIEQYANNPARTEKQPAFEALRLPGSTYVEYGSGEREYYDLQSDPWETENLAATADPALLKTLSTCVDRMKTCVAAECRAVESEALPAKTATPTN
jgi:N-acetylglucosamine-6-sulfatase